MGGEDWEASGSVYNYTEATRTTDNENLGLDQARTEVGCVDRTKNDSMRR